jgi:Fe-S cluster biogenesis protein NfuA/nitrite reductase/ring-hydroxylating ferredoxin subunit
LDEQAEGDRVARVDALLGEIEHLPDPGAREKATEMVQALLDLYGEGFARALARLDDERRAAIADDELVSHLLLLHDLHPVPVEERVRRALDDVRPYLESHGGNVELVAVQDGAARVRLQGSCSGCPSSTMTLKLAIEDAIGKAAPDIESVEAEGVSAPPSPPLLQIEMSDALAPKGSPDDAWATAGALPELSSGGVVLKTVAGERVLFLRVADTFYAYRPACPSCGESLEGAVLEGAELDCSCGLRYDVRRAGRCLDEPEVHLDPVPLLVGDAGLVKVAVGGGVG